MQVLAVVGASGSGTTTLVERLAGRLAERGRVATVTRLADAPDLDAAGTDTARHRAAGAATTVGLADEEWFRAGEGRSLDDALAALAPDHEYALVEGYHDRALAKVALGGVDAADPVIARAADAADADLGAIVDSIEDVDSFETLESLVAEATRADGSDRAGAIATFTGRVRRTDGPDDAPTERLEFETYDGVADDRMATIREELCAREGVQEVLLHHRTGVLEAGEDIVFVVVLAGHREEAFATVSDGIDRLKAEVPIFKKEVTVEETFWRHEE